MRIRSVLLLSYWSLAVAATASTFPSLSYSTYLRDSFTPSAIATDAAGNIYLAGKAVVDPATSQTTTLVVKLNPQATQYLYVRYVGGSVNETASALAVDSAGNAWVAGVTTSPDFPIIGSGNLGTPPVTATERSFVYKLDSDGQIVFSDLLGGSTNSYAQAVAVNSSGQVLVSGTSVGTGFPSTPGVYSVSDTTSVPYLLELDSTGKTVLFSATGIGGSSLALDSSGNIYMAGTTSFVSYPTTPGTYQSTFPVFKVCIAPCTGSVQFQGPNQYVTKLDPTGARMIFSTAISGTGNTINEGLAVDSAGNVYVTGLAGAGYPYTVTPPSINSVPSPALTILATPALPFLSKLDPSGQKLLFSVPVGGLGVRVDSSGLAYVGGVVGKFSNYDVTASLPALANIPSACLLPETNGGNSAYVSQVDSSGNVFGSQFIGGSTLNVSGIALAGGALWIAGATSLPNFPFTSGALTAPNLRPIPLPGAYLGAVTFSSAEPPAATPRIACIVDSANFSPAGPLVPYQLVTIFGSGLGPATPAVAADYSTTTLGGVSVSIGSLPAPLLYVSSNQINVAVPLVSAGPSGVPVDLVVNGLSSSPVQFPVTSANPGLFVVEGSYQSTYQDFLAVALNADGSVNSAANPAQLGSAISVFVNGLSANPNMLFVGSPWSVTGSSQINPFVLQVALQTPSTAVTPAPVYCSSPTSVCVASFKIYDLPSYLGAEPSGAGGLSFTGLVYITQ